VFHGYEAASLASPTTPRLADHGLGDPRTRHPSIRRRLCRGNEATSDDRNARPTVVLVHGDWADGSNWNAVTKRLIARGYNVVVPPNLLRGPNEDSPYLKSYLESIQGPIVLAAHS
jgi:hypothetical protein